MVTSSINIAACHISYVTVAYQCIADLMILTNCNMNTNKEVKLQEFSASQVDYF